MSPTLAGQRRDARGLISQRQGPDSGDKKRESHPIVNSHVAIIRLWFCWSGHHSFETARSRDLCPEEPFASTPFGYPGVGMSRVPVTVSFHGAGGCQFVSRFPIGTGVRVAHRCVSTSMTYRKGSPRVFFRQPTTVLTAFKHERIFRGIP